VKYTFLTLFSFSDQSGKSNYHSLSNYALMGGYNKGGNMDTMLLEGMQ
jgi:hypothetical protein